MADHTFKHFGNIRVSLVRLTYQTPRITKSVRYQLGKCINELDKAMEMYINALTRSPRTIDEDKIGNSKN